MDAHRFFDGIASKNNNFAKDILAWRERMSGQELFCFFFLEPSDRDVRSEMPPFAGLTRHAFRERCRTDLMQGQE